MRTSLLLSLLVGILTLMPIQIAAGRMDLFYILAASEISLEIDFGNETVLNFSGLNGTNVLEVTESVVDVVKEWYGDLVYVTSIAGVPNDSNEGLFWQYWVNGKLGPVAANKHQVEENDLISWRRLPPEESGTNGTTTSLLHDQSLFFWTAALSALGFCFLAGLYILKKKG